MAVITVPASGALVSNVTLNDTLQAAASVNLNGSPVFYEVDGASTLRSLFIGYDIQLNIGFLYSGTLTGTGSITGATDATAGNLPLIYNYGTLDINGTIGVNLSNEGRLVVAAGERLGIDADLFSFGSSIVLVASGGELDINSRDPAVVSSIDVQGAVELAAPLTTFTTVTNTGAIDVTSGTLNIDSSLQGSGTITVASGAVLSLDVAMGETATGTIALERGSTFQLGTPSSFAGTLQLAQGAQIDLLGLSASTATVANGMIAIATNAGTINLGETGLINGTTLAIAGDGAGGSLLSLSIASSTAPGTSTPVPGSSASASPGTPSADPPVYRFFDTTNGTHFFTGSSAEVASLEATRPDLTYEGVGLYSADPTTDPNAAPVFRFFDQTYGTHFYTSSATEMATVEATRSDLTYEGIGFYEHTTPQSGDVPVYRFFDQTYGTHFYTASATEEANIVATRPDLVNEGIGFYAPSS